MRPEETDLLVIGGGPAGSTAAAIFRKYNPELSVTIVERASFPRYHIGESLVLEVNRVLGDAGVLDQLERSDFLHKGGATYVWGATRKPWSFLFSESAGRRPHFEGMRDYTWHVDRGRFDAMLLDHARALGANVWQPAEVVRPIQEGERVVGAEVAHPSGELQEVRARFVIDASGRAGTLAKRFGRREFDPLLRNVATFGYFEGGTLEPDYSLDWDEAAIAIVSIPDGWLWYIPMRRGLVSVGVVTSAERFKELTRDGVEPFYERAVRSAGEPRRWLESARLVHYEGAPRRVMVESDFNYVHSRLWGPGWALVGDSGGFVDPLFTFGVFMATTGAQLLAYCLGTMFSGHAGATEERVLSAYEQHMRGYYDAFRAMLCVFYGFNSTKESFWAQTRELLRGHALPRDIGDRDAFMAFTFGYGVNTRLFRDATVHFGQVALNRIRDMCLDEEMGRVSLSQMGEFDVVDLEPTATPRLACPYRCLESVVPIAGSGRVVPMTRVELDPLSKEDVGARFPRYLFVPDELLFVFERLDGKTPVRTLLDEARKHRGARSASADDAPRFVAHLLRSLSAMGALETPVTGESQGPSSASPITD